MAIGIPEGDQSADSSTSTGSLADVYRQSALGKFGVQLRILEERTDEEFSALTRSQTDEIRLQHALVLDLETYYTVAHDLLKVAEQLLPSARRSALRRERTYKNVCTIRSWLVRHAYDKPRGDPYDGFGYDRKHGPMLKMRSPFRRLGDPGFFVNRRELHVLIAKYGIDALATAHHPQSRFTEVLRSKMSAK